MLKKKYLGKIPSKEAKAEKCKEDFSIQNVTYFQGKKRRERWSKVYPKAANRSIHCASLLSLNSSTVIIGAAEILAYNYVAIREKI